MKTKILFGSFAILVVITLAGCSYGSGQTQNTTSSSPVSTNAITINNFAFSPSLITVAAGTSVTITNNDSAPHRPISDDGTSFDFGQLSPGQAATKTLDKAGTFSYHCSIHPSMTGTIIVK